MKIAKRRYRDRLVLFARGVVNELIANRERDWPEESLVDIPLRAAPQVLEGAFELGLRPYCDLHDKRP
jgi:hypothetical protein